MKRILSIKQSRRKFIQGSLGCFGIAATESTFGRSLGVPVNAANGRTREGALASSAFTALPLGSVQPRGWLARQLRLQADGLSGHLGETWPDVGPESGWLGGLGESGERGPYYLDGLIPLAFLLNDETLKRKALRFVDWTLQSQQANGMFGPEHNNDWWPRMVMLKALTQYQEVSGDSRVVLFLSRYFAYQRAQIKARPLSSWGKFRWQDEMLSVLWLYRHTHDPELLELAGLLHAQGHDWISGFRDFQFHDPVTWAVIHAHGDDGSGDFALSSHGVNNAMAIKTGPVWYLLSGNASDRDAVFESLKCLDRYHGLPNGMFSCDEHLAGRSPVHGSELCSVVETMFSLEQALAITGDASLADRLEMIAFNPLPGAFTDDMWAHQYNQQPNQVECSVHTKPWTTDGPESNLYGLAPHFGCCTANYHQGWPKFAASIFMKTADDGFVAAVYAPCEMTTTVRGEKITIIEETDYPFREEIRFRISVEKPAKFPLVLRVPSWCTEPQLRINDEATEKPASGRFVKLEREWRNNDMVMLRLPMSPRLVHGAESSVSVNHGPLVFSFPVGECWLKLRNRGLTADWQVYPATQWNYALIASDANFDVLPRPIGARPFTSRESGVEIKAKARKIPRWRAQDCTANPIPALTVEDVREAEEVITLKPYAAAKLRISAFPYSEV